jgi:hypothetical protein
MAEQDHQVRIEALRRAASSELKAIALAAGPESPLYECCYVAWRLREADASTSILFADLPNAVTILDRGVHSLRHALEASRRERMAPEELFSLMVSC